METLLNEDRVYYPSKEVIERAHIKSFDAYLQLYKKSIHQPNAFWLDQAQTLDWFTFPKTACEFIWNTNHSKISHTWFADGTLNLSFNCLDRHLEKSGEKTALIWQGESDQEQEIITFKQLYQRVCRFANMLKERGIQKGDRVCIYLPMIPEAAIAMLACSRIGAIHSVVFGGFSAESLAHRIEDSQCKLLITSNISLRGAKEIPLKALADEALTSCSSIENVLVVKRNQSVCNMVEGRDHFTHELLSKASSECPPEALNAEDPLFILYTSGSTGKPKGVVHTQGGYLLHTSLSHKLIFDIHDDDIYWCTADVGWVTGHSYVIYGPLANGCTTLMFEGTPTYPNNERFWQVIAKHRVTAFYTAPTAIRALIACNTEGPNHHDLSSLRVLGTVGEPINPAAWMWYYNTVGKGKCPIVDTWWQTETGGIMITPFPGSHPLKPGSATRPFFGVEPVILKEDGTEAPVNDGGALCIKQPWPGMMRSMWGDHKRFIETYFSQFPNLYFTGDAARIDLDGDIWLLGRMDDVVNISGHRMGTAEVESALVSHEKVAEAAVVPVFHSIKGEALFAFVTLMKGCEGSAILEKELANHVRKVIGPIAIPEKIQFARALPKTRSGKIMRRLLKRIAAGDLSDLGDTSTLADPDVLKDLIH